MKKFLVVSAVLLVVLFAGFTLLAVNLTAETAPGFAEEPLESLSGEIMSAMLTGEEVPVTQGQLNRMISLLPTEHRENLLGVELTGENTARVWARTKLFAHTCYVQAEVCMAFDPETAALCCTVGAVKAGNVPIPEKLVARLLEEYRHGLDFSGKSIIINVNDIARTALQADAAAIQNLRCDETAVYLTPMSAGDLLGSLLGGNF